MKKLIIISVGFIFFAVNAANAGTAPTPTPTPTPVNSGNINLQNPELYTALEETSKKGKLGLENILAGAVIAGVITYAVCTACQASCSNCITWGLTAAALGGAVAAAASRSNDVADKALKDVSVRHDPTAPPPPPGSGPGNNSNDNYVRRYNESIATLRNRGIIVDPKKQTLTLPNGKTYTQASLTTPAAMQAAGITASDVAKMQKDLKDKVDKELKKGSDGTESDSGYASGSGGARSETAAEFAMPNQPTLGIDRNPAQVQGLSVNYNGEPIGVSRSFIFQSITNRIDVIESRDEVLTSP